MFHAAVPMREGDDAPGMARGILASRRRSRAGNRHHISGGDGEWKHLLSHTASAAWRTEHEMLGCVGMSGDEGHTLMGGGLRCAGLERCGPM